MGVLRRSSIEAIQPKLPEIGRLFKGGPKEAKTSSKGKEYLGYGKDLDHFRFVADDRLRLLPSNNYSSLKEEVETKWLGMEEMTGGWRSIPILLPYKTLDQNFFWRNAVYDASGKTTRSCNGEICDRQTIDAKKADGKPYKATIKGYYPCAMKEGDTECPAGCKAEGKLAMIIPALYPGLVLITTKSIIDIQTIQANLEGYSRFDLSRIPLRLCRSLRDASYTNSEGEYKKQEKWLLHIEIDPQYGQMALEAQQQQYKAELMGQQVGGYLSANNVRSLPPAPVAIQFVSKEQSLDLWNMAKANGFTQDDAKAVLQSRGISSFNEIPIEEYPDLHHTFSQRMEDVVTVS